MAVDELTQSFAELESEASRLETNVAANEAEVARLEAEAESRREIVAEAAVARFVAPPRRTVAGAGDDLLAEVRGRHLAETALASDADQIENYALLVDELDAVRARMEADRLAAANAQEALVDARAELGELLAELEELEAARLEELRRQAEEEARRRAEEAARRAAEAAAAGGNDGSGTEGSGADTGGTTVVQPSGNSGLLVFCPVQGSVSFVDTWGAPRSGGRSHKGVDMFASIGTPVVAPVSGTVTLRSNRLGGRSFHLNGDDGNYYYGTHLSAYGESGQVAAGTVIGYVGDDGNARGIPHLHFEIHPGGRGAVNPYPATRDAC